MYSPETYEGHWKQLTVRTTRTNEIMAVVYFNPQVRLIEQESCEKSKDVLTCNKQGISEIHTHLQTQQWGPFP